jgi:hypothetical protein
MSAARTPCPCAASWLPAPCSLAGKDLTFANSATYDFACVMQKLPHFPSRAKIVAAENSKSFCFFAIHLLLSCRQTFFGLPTDKFAALMTP